MACRIVVTSLKLIVGKFDLNEIVGRARDLVDLVVDIGLIEIFDVVVPKNAHWIWKFCPSSNCVAAPKDRTCADHIAVGELLAQVGDLEPKSFCILLSGK